MPKTTIIVDSHQLSEFQRCPRLYNYAQIQRRGTSRLKDALTKGSGLHNLLYIYYKSKIMGLPTQKCITNTMRYMRWQKSMSKEHIQLVWPRVLQYFAHYQNETWVPKQVEIGFSKRLYEDRNFLFVYEGKIDFIGKVSGTDFFADHKSQASQKQLPQDSNQFLGYAWATGFSLGIINYLNLAPSKSPKDAFRREICNYSPQLVDEWREGAIYTCFQMVKAMNDGNYRKQRNGCLGAYGLCDFLEVCKQTNVNVINGMLNRDFIIKEEWSPWE